MVSPMGAGRPQSLVATRQALPRPIVPSTMAKNDAGTRGRAGTRHSESAQASILVPEDRDEQGGDCVRAARLHKPGHMTVEDVARPVVGPHDLVVRVEATGICGSDRHMFRGEYPTALPVTLGHEFCGIVEELGPRAARQGRRQDHGRPQHRLRALRGVPQRTGQSLPHAAGDRRDARWRLRAICAGARGAGAGVAAGARPGPWARSRSRWPVACTGSTWRGSSRATASRCWAAA